MPDHPNVRRFLDLSTAHLSPDTRDAWDFDSSPQWVTPTRDGFFVWAGTDEDSNADLPPEVATCRSFARSLGCDYLLFDADAEIIEGLEVFEDE